MAEINCDGKSIREINTEIKRLMSQGETDILVKNPNARHNLGVALLQPVHLTFDSSVGYYCGGMMDGATIEVKGSAGWGLAESMLSGTVLIHGSAGNGAAASIRGGTVVVDGNAAARAAVSMKGGLVVVAGNCGYMAGFMGQRGTLIVCGDTGEAFGDSMYEMVCYVGGRLGGLGNDAVVEEPSAEERAFLQTTLSRHFGSEDLTAPPKMQNFKKVVSGRKLWNFDKREWTTWREAF